MRDKYHQLLLKHGLQDTLHLIPELSYSRKLTLLNDLLEHYESNIVNRALNEYERVYIKMDRVNLHAIKGFLLGLCGRCKVAKDNELNKYKRRA